MFHGHGLGNWHGHGDGHGHGHGHDMGMDIVTEIVTASDTSHRVLNISRPRQPFLKFESLIWDICKNINPISEIMSDSTLFSLILDVLISSSVQYHTSRIWDLVPIFAQII
jgi:deoxyhypusine synthase